MEIPRELTIRCGDDDRLLELMTEISRNLPSGWSGGVLGVLREGTGSHRIIHNFRWVGRDRFPACELNFLQTGPGSCSVCSVMPRGEGRLSLSDRNAALVEFEKIARPGVERLGMEMELTTDQFDINEELSEAAAEKLRLFSRSANKGLGGALPIDRERWLDFVVTAHRDGCKLPATMLREWLIEDEGWYFEDADRLAGEYEFGGRILSYSEHQTA